MLDLAEWFAGGERVPVTLSDGKGRSRTYHIFCRVVGSGPWVTFLHGFPTCSWDWAKIEPALQARHRLLLFDFLGFGDSDKPTAHHYSIFEQADLTQALWRHYGIAQTALVAHDYGDTVATELLARQAEGKLDTHVTRAVLLNGGIYVDVYKPLLIQTLLRQPVLGPAISRLINERSFARSFRAIFSPRHPISEAEMRQHWAAIQRRDGTRNYHALIGYISERHAQRKRWEQMIERGPTPLNFIWGTADPVSGGPIAARLRERAAHTDIMELVGVGHYPQIEVPAVVSEALVVALDR